MENKRYTNIDGEAISCIQVIKNEVALESLNVPDDLVDKYLDIFHKQYQDSTVELKVIPLYI